MFAAVATTSDQRFTGAASLAGSINATAAGPYVLEVDPAMPAIAAGVTITFHLFIPPGAPIAWVQPYIQDSVYAFTGVYAPSACVAPGAWTKVVLTVPTDAAAPVGRLGVQIYVSEAWTGTVYVDSVSW